MAQLLVCSVPNPGHFNPMLTLSRHLAAAGHTILFYTAETFQSKGTAAHSTGLATVSKALYRSENTARSSPRSVYAHLDRIRSITLYLPTSSLQWFGISRNKAVAAVFYSLKGNS